MFMHEEVRGGGGSGDGGVVCVEGGGFLKVVAAVRSARCRGRNTERGCIVSPHKVPVWLSAPL